MLFKNFTLEDRRNIQKAYSPLIPFLKKGELVDPYLIWPRDWCLYMSPIERNIWNRLRETGAVFYPQVPCGPYFIDFASPSLGIAIEADGKEWHQDFKKDLERETFLKNNGYKSIIRMSGHQTYKLDDWSDEFFTKIIYGYSGYFFNLEEDKKWLYE